MFLAVSPMCPTARAFGAVIATWHCQIGPTGGECATLLCDRRLGKGFRARQGRDHFKTITGTWWALAMLMVEVSKMQLALSSVQTGLTTRTGLTGCVGGVVRVVGVDHSATSDRSCWRHSAEWRSSMTRGARCCCWIAPS